MPTLRDSARTHARRLATRHIVAQVLGLRAARVWEACLADATRTRPHLVEVLERRLPGMLARWPSTRHDEAAMLVREVLASRPEALDAALEELPELARDMDAPALGRFVRHALGQRDAAACLARATVAAAASARAASGVVFLDALRPMLERYAAAHAGTPVTVEIGAPGLPHPGRITLPARIDLGPERHAEARRHYLGMTLHAAAHLEFGSRSLALDALSNPHGDAWPDARDDEDALDRFLRAFPMPTLARDLYRAVEGARILRAVRQHYPAAAERTAEAWAWVHAQQAPSPITRRLAGLLQGAGAEAAPATPRPPRGDVAADLAVEAFVATWGPSFREASRGTAEDSARWTVAAYADARASLPVAADGPVATPTRTATAPSRPRPARPDPPTAPVPLPPDPRPSTRHPDEAVDGEDGRGALVARAREASAPAARARDPDGDPLREIPTTGSAVVTMHPEWDWELGDHRPAWVRVVERRVAPGPSAFVEEVRHREAARIHRLRGAFLALRPDARARRRSEPDGDDLDVDRAVEEILGRRAGAPLPSRAYTRDVRRTRDVAIGFLLDVSSSTNESPDGSGTRVIDVQRTALVVAGDALSAAGDTFAAWAYSGSGRSRVDVFVAKDFRDPWDEKAARRVGNLRPSMENRDGAAIRHATRLLSAHPARHRLLVVLSDGRPLDCACPAYRDRYAIEDTRAALREARAHGVHPFCVTVDSQARGYLADMAGAVSYTVIERAEQLPERLVAVVRRLTAR
jgi:nitric oxide reductase activation protein